MTASTFMRIVLWLAISAAALLCHPASAQEPSPEVVPIAHVTSAECLACHDGSAAPPVARDTSHHYDVDYAAVQPSLRRYLKTAGARSGLGSTVAEDCLVGGRVECVSCHATHEQETTLRFRLRAAIPQICRGCHNIG